MSWHEILAEPRALLLVAESPDFGAVGYLLGHSHLAFFTNGPIAWVEELMVDQRARRLGVGKGLLHHAEEWARSIGAAYLSLASRRAGAFYRALGYDESAIFYKKNM